MPKAAQRLLAPPPKPAQPEAAEPGQPQAAEPGQPQAAQECELKVEKTEDPDEPLAAEPNEQQAEEPGQPPAAEPGQPQAAEGMFTVPENQAVAGMVPITHGPQFFEDSKGHWFNAKGNRVDEFGRETHKRGLSNLDRPSKQKWRNHRNGYGRVWWDKRDGDWRGTGTAKWTGGGWQGGGASSSGGSGSGVVAWHGVASSGGKGGKQ